MLVTPWIQDLLSLRRLWLIGAFCLIPLLFPSTTLAANPTLSWSTYIGGSRLEHPRDIAFDPQGNIYVVGGTESSDFADSTKKIGQPFGGTSCNTNNRGSAYPMDVFVAKYSPLGQLLWWQYLGGPCYDRAYAIETYTNSAGQTFLYVAGRAGFAYPVSPSGVVQSSFGGDTDVNALYGTQDGFITKLDSNGTIKWSTFVGTADRDFIRDIAVDNQGNVYAGMAQVGLSFAPGPIRTALDNSPLYKNPNSDHSPNSVHDPVLLEISPDGNQVLFGTYLGGSGEDLVPSVRVDSQGNIYVAYGTKSNDNPVVNGFQTQNGGTSTTSLVDNFLVKISPAHAITYSTYIGGSGNDGGETHFLGIDNAGMAYVTNYTDSPNFPFPQTQTRTARQGISDAFLVKIDTTKTGTDSHLATLLLGGSGGEGSEGIEVGLDAVYVGGLTSSLNFPNASNSCGLVNNSCNDAFFAKISLDLKTVLYARYLGGNGDAEAQRGLALGPNNQIASTGYTNSTNLPSQAPYKGNTDGFIALFTQTNLPGDFNTDGVIDFRDFSTLKQAYSTTNCLVNLTGNTCLINLFDFNNFLSRY